MARPNKFSAIADDDARRVEAEFLSVSFEFVDWGYEDIFFIHGLEPAHYHKLFDCISTIKKSLEKQILEQNHPSLEPKSIFNDKKSIKSEFPASIVEAVAQKLRYQIPGNEKSDAIVQAKEIVSRAFEVRVAKSYGRIHGFVWNKCFHIVWFDPAHNLYPYKGAIRIQKEYATVRCFSPDVVVELKEKNKQLVDEYNQLKSEYDELYEEFANR